ncbi:MAG: hypothetical protein IT583_02400 [Verrucomicrobia bacterium]|nr:hypothetical protein [Verrucomicrobiota bacterium]
MNWGCLSFLILFPAGIFIWAAGERRRRAAMPPEELKELEAEEKYGHIDDKLECIFCHSKNCVRTKLEAVYEDGTDANSSEGIVLLLTSSTRNGTPPKDEYIKARCMNCNSYWNMFPETQE